MRQSTALASCPELVEHPLPLRAARQLRMALELLPDRPAAAPGPKAACNPAEAGSPALEGRGHVITGIATGSVLEVVGTMAHPHLAWPERPPRARMADGSAAERRPDFYDWLLRKRRRAQIAARRAIAGA